jgi:tetratricopeptide (TPR) repeat protein
MAERDPVARVLERRARADYRGACEEALRTVGELESQAGASSRDLFELLVELGRLQHDCGEATDAESTFERALAVAGELPGSQALRARALARLSAVYRDQGRFDQAERAAQDALRLAPEESLEAADALVELASGQFAVTKYDAAEESCLRAFRLAENAPPRLERDRVRTRTHATLGSLHRARGRYADAEGVLRETIELAEQSFGPDSLETADALNDLAIVFKYAGRFDEAEPLYRRALDINVSAVGETHYNVASIYHNLGGLEHARGNHEEAEPHARRSAEIRRQAVGPDHPSTAADEAALASILYELRKDEEAERLLRRAISTYETVYGGEHYELSVHLNNLAAILQRRQAHAEAEALYRRSLAMKEKLIGPEHPMLANTLNNLAVICRRDGRHDEAERLYERALALLEAGVEPGHPTLARTRRNYATLLRAMGRDDAAREPESTRP